MLCFTIILDVSFFTSSLPPSTCYPSYKSQSTYEKSELCTSMNQVLRDVSIYIPVDLVVYLLDSIIVVLCTCPVGYLKYFTFACQ